jgi:LuxR family transcriptional regulator, maltose regulon positive regulatory protein
MARHPIPKVIDDRLTSPAVTGEAMPAIMVGSAGWYAWLSDATTRSFAFHSPEGVLTARRERRHGTWYWYAYRSHHGHLSKAYLGKSEELTTERLHNVAAMLATSTLTSRPMSDTPSPTTPPDATLPSSVASPTTSASPAEIPLLMTKLYVPHARENMVSRPRLVERMNAGMKGTLTLIVAPAGWGKTTLLSAWHTDPSRPAQRLAWVSLDAGDNDPVRFWTCVIVALNTPSSSVGETALALLHSPQSPPIESVLTLLLNALATRSTETVLVLDDYHLIEAQPIHDSLTFLLDHLPSQLHLVIASRLDPPLPLARLRARGSLIELRTADLRFTPQEAAAFLTEVMGLPLSLEDIVALESRTEGWIAGLHLAALSLQGRDDLTGFITAFAGSNRYIIDYLVEEVLARQPENVQHFLAQTCVLARLSSSLCDAVRGTDESQALLEYLERTNLFIIAFDDQRQWYRYHHLFAEVLRNRLQQTQPTEVPELHRRACGWYQQHQMFAEAVTHALAIPDVQRVADLIEQHGYSFALQGQLSTMLGWYKQLPDTLILTRPRLCLLHAFVLLLTNQIEVSSARLLTVERAIRSAAPTEETQSMLGQVALIRGYISLYFGDVASSVQWCRQALDLLPETETGWWASSFLGTARAYLVSGEVTSPVEERVEAAVSVARASGNLVTLLSSISLLGRLQVLQGRLRTAVHSYGQAKDVAPGRERLQTLVNSADFYFGMGDLLRERNELDEAERHLKQGMDLAGGTLTVYAEIVTLGYIALARLQEARGNFQGALVTLSAFAELAHQRRFVPRLLARGAAVQAQLELAHGHLTAAVRWMEESGLSASDEAMSYAREPEYLTLVRVYIAEGREKPTGPFLSEALVLLVHLLKDAESNTRMSSVIEILILRALALEVQGERAEALTALDRALTLAAPEGYMRLFIDEGAPMAALLRQTHMHDIVPGYVAHLLEAFAQVGASPYPPDPNAGPLVEALTGREREVLQLVVDGASNREIAERLVLSVNTVKKHVFNICGKLGVQSRTQAIARSRSLGLLL